MAHLAEELLVQQIQDRERMRVAAAIRKNQATFRIMLERG
jgi:hypothetical protein